MLHVDTGEIENDRITVELIGGNTKVPVTVDPNDGIVILRIMNTNEKVQFVAYKDDIATAKIFNLTGLTLEEEE